MIRVIYPSYLFHFQPNVEDVIFIRDYHNLMSTSKKSYFEINLLINFSLIYTVNNLYVFMNVSPISYIISKTCRTNSRYLPSPYCGVHIQSSCPKGAFSKDSVLL